MTGGDTVNAKVQIDTSGNMTVTGGVDAAGVTTNRVHGGSTGRAGFIFAGSSLIYPADHNGAGTNGVASLGSSGYKYKDAYFSTLSPLALSLPVGTGMRQGGSGLLTLQRHPCDRVGWHSDVPQHERRDELGTK